MNFVAHGIDIVEIERIQREINAPGSVWITAVYSDDEQALAEPGSLRFRYYAGRYAGKEAVAKALGTGFSGDIIWQGIEILRSKNGAPSVRLNGEALNRAKRCGIAEWLVSISYSSTLAIASVIAVSDPPAGRITRLGHQFPADPN